VRLGGLFSNATDQEILERIGRMVPGWSFEVNPRGIWGSGFLIHIRLWKENHTEEIDVNPIHYIDHRDSEVRENPALAALADGIKRFKRDLAIKVR